MYVGCLAFSVAALLFLHKTPVNVAEQQHGHNDKIVDQAARRAGVKFRLRRIFG
jgi:hypothetical protein